MLYEEVDESDVQLLHIVSSTDDETGVDEYRYPKAGGCELIRFYPHTQE